MIQRLDSNVQMMKQALNSLLHYVLRNCTMDGLSESLREALSPAMAEELQILLEEMAEEAEEKERILNLTLERLLGDIKTLEQIRKMEEEGRQWERASLKAALEAARREPLEQSRKALTYLRDLAQMRTEEFEKEREKRYALEWELKRVNFLLELKEDKDYDALMAKETERMIADSERWARQTKEKELSTLAVALAAAAMKQRLLKELKSQAEKWMVRNVTIRDLKLLKLVDHLNVFIKSTRYGEKKQTDKTLCLFSSGV